MRRLNPFIATALASLLICWTVVAWAQLPPTFAPPERGAAATEGAAAATEGASAVRTGAANPNGSLAPRSLHASATSFLKELDIEDLSTENTLQNGLVLLAFTVGAAALGRVLAFLLQRLTVRLKKRAWHAHAQLFAGMASPLSLAVFAIGLSLGFAQLTMSDPLKNLSEKVLLLLYAIAGFWYAYNLVEALEIAIKRFSIHTETELGDDIVPVIRKLLRAIIVVIAALFILQNVFGRDIGAWLTGLGIAGLAVSLAAQDSLKNLFGSLTILFDRPFVSGQRIKFRGFDGTVEDIGFRSTKIRTTDGSLVTIPNSNIVNDPVDNWALRPRIGRTMNLRLRYDTPVEKVKEAVEIIRKIFQSEEFRTSVYSETLTGAPIDRPQVFFNDFNPDSLNIQISYWYRPASDSWGYLVYCEKFNLRLLEELTKAKIALTVPAQTTLVENMAAP